MAESRTHILLISQKLFLQKSFKEVTLKEIVRESGLSKGAFYHYFESKEQLFHEIFDHFFKSVLEFDFNQLPKESLHGFYISYAEQVNKQRFQFLYGGRDHGEDFFTLNFFRLLFDAIRLFPELRVNLEAFHDKERAAWIEAIGNARSTGEIGTPLSDEQIAQIFMFTSDGLTMNLTMESDTGYIDEKLAGLWDNFYETLRTVNKM